MHFRRFAWLSRRLHSYAISAHDDPQDGQARGLRSTDRARDISLAIVAMLLTGTVHPPAGADPIVVVLAGARWSFLAVPVLTGAVTIVVAGLLFRKFVLGRPSPTKE